MKNAQRATYYEHMSTRLEVWETAIAEMAQLAAGTRDGSRPLAVARVREVEAPLMRVRAKLQELADAPDTTWDRVQAEVERAWAELKDAALGRTEQQAAA